jgi:hypothetical protein
MELYDVDASLPACFQITVEMCQINGFTRLTWVGSMRTLASARVLRCEFGDVPDLAIDHDPAVLWRVVF